MGLTQQEFAYQLGTAITTIARYETDREPKGKPLSTFFDLAQQLRRDDLAEVFQAARSKQARIMLRDMVDTWRRTHAEDQQWLHAEQDLRSLRAADLSADQRNALDRLEGFLTALKQR